MRHFIAAVLLFGCLLFPEMGFAYNLASLEQLLKTKQCPGCDLRGAPMANVDLSGANLDALAKNTHAV